MAEGLLRHLGGDRCEAYGAGTAPAARVHPLAVATMRERGVDISAQRPKDLSVFEGQHFDLLITTCDDADEACPYFAGARDRLYWSLPDPARATGSEEEVRQAFRRVADELTRRIGALLDGWGSD